MKIVKCCEDIYSSRVFKEPAESYRLEVRLGKHWYIGKTTYNTQKDAVARKMELTAMGMSVRIVTTDF